jgi:hypothetical protein
MTLSNTQTVVRGSTVQFTTTFYDVNNDVTQPGSATVSIAFPNPDGTTGSTSLPMTAPVSPAVAWIATWDTRGAGIGAVAWSIHSDPGPPFAVEDGNFTLTGNAANLLTFP